MDIARIKLQSEPTLSLGLPALKSDCNHVQGGKAAKAIQIQHQHEIVVGTPSQMKSIKLSGYHKIFKNKKPVWFCLK